MIAETLSHWPYGFMSGMAMLLFMAVFVGIAYRAYGPGSEERYFSADKLPLADLTPISKSKEGTKI